MVAFFGEVKHSEKSWWADDSADDESCEGDVPASLVEMFVLASAHVSLLDNQANVAAYDWQRDIKADEDIFLSIKLHFQVVGTIFPDGVVPLLWHWVKYVTVN